MLDLPLDLLPSILEHFEHPRHLYTACLVNKDFYNSAIPELYGQIIVYHWHKQIQVKVIKLFRTLASSPVLARHVFRLAIHAFPRSLPLDELDVMNIVASAVKNCVNLKVCAWTRDGSLTSDVLRSLGGLHHLRKLEINGHDQGNFQARLLLQLTRLNTITIIMPSAAVIALLPEWFEALAENLTGLTLICKSTSLVNNDVLGRLAPHLRHLQSLYLVGCPKVTHSGLWKVLKNNEAGLRSLGLEGITSRFDIGHLVALTSASNVLHTLRSFTVTVNHQTPLEQWTQDIFDLLLASPLEVFQIYSSGPVLESPPTVDLWKRIVSVHGKRLRRFSVHRMLIGMESIDDICRRCPNLKELFIVVEHQSLKQLQSILPLVQRLEVLHINFPIEAQSEMPIDDGLLSPAEAHGILECCPSTLTQLGGNTQVWQVERVFEGDGGKEMRRHLVRYNRPDIPEQFMVIRTA
ncbi:hypothetical protein CYLTODRAFT_437122 [Cylindrobasidium torrendii FP15055 ss-10]|uniref:F-box domain-containing protein n=1 Tax=Cylindrobasidium torrendii FP15055 ss-10 TaxID=1314674 RepID=A0A0D7B9M1_9AGAR|nr:hypothetical protein CYLTODRAFT_437122 [Cylindrobasidium torrendii FP15055 ss-10]